MDNFKVENFTNNDFPIVVSIPHSGTYVPKRIRRLMKKTVVLTNSDWYLPELYSFLIDMGITQIKSNISRYTIDLNRDVNGGIGGDYHNLVYEYTTQNRPIYNSALQADDVKRRINEYYLPYHNALEQLIENKLKHHSKIFLFDLHSFGVNFTNEDNGDVILSDYDHITASPQTMKLVRKEFENVGFTVTENIIKGGYITVHYGTKFKSLIESIQIELRYAAYLENRYFGEEEVKKWDKEVFSTAQQKIKQSFTNLLKLL